MPRDLADVLHYFLPELDDAAAADAATRETSRLASLRSSPERTTAVHEPAYEAGPQGPHTWGEEPLLAGSSEPFSADAAGFLDTAGLGLEFADPTHPSAPEPRGSRTGARRPLPILGLPIGDRDVVRAALAWNLAIETARLGAASILLAPASDTGSPLWPEPGVGPLGSELHFCPASHLAELYQAATALAWERAQSDHRGGIVFVRIPPSWLDVGAIDGAADLEAVRWLLLLTSSNRHDLDESIDLAKILQRTLPGAEVGVTIHGVKSITEARQAFEYLSRVSEEDLGLLLTSYGLLVDDLHVYRAIAAQRPIGLAHPQAAATRALMDVARLLCEDARSQTLE